MRKLITLLTIFFLFAACSEGDFSPSNISFTDPSKGETPLMPITGVWTSSNTYLDYFSYKYKGQEVTWEITSDSISIVVEEFDNYYNYQVTHTGIVQYGYTLHDDSIRTTWNGNIVWDKPYQVNTNKLIINFHPLEDYILVK